MTDRMYLPYQSLREYRDRGMLKWMGFFLSEHTSSLEFEKKFVPFSFEMDLMDKVLRINQAYTQKLEIEVDVAGKTEKKHYIGLISHVGRETISLKTEEGYISIDISSILSMKVRGIRREQEGFI